MRQQGKERGECCLGVGEAAYGTACTSPLVTATKCLGWEGSS